MRKPVYGNLAGAYRRQTAHKSKSDDEWAELTAVICVNDENSYGVRWLVTASYKTVYDGESLEAAMKAYDQALPLAIQGNEEEPLTGAQLGAKRCVEIAEERYRLLHRDASAQSRNQNHEMAWATELKADQFAWIANAIQREFGL